MFLRDKNGSPISYFTQWDKSQYVFIYNWEYSAIPKLHCSNRQMNESSPIEATRVDASTIKALIPDGLLTKALPVDISIFLIDTADGSETTVFRDKIPVRAKAKPSDQPYDNDEDTSGNGGGANHNCLIVSNNQPSSTSVLWFDTGTPI